MGEALLFQVLVYLGALAAAAVLGARLGVGSVLGFLVLGAVIGPQGLKLLSDPESVGHMAEFGVVIMLFLIGLEIRPRALWNMRSELVVLGGAQIALCGLAIMGATMLVFDLEWRAGLAVGLVLALSSTALVLQSLKERGGDRTATGRRIFSVLLMQDLMIIPFLMVIPFLGGVYEPAAAAHGAEHASGHGEAGAHGAAAFIVDAPMWLQALLAPAAVAAVVIVAAFGLRPVFRVVARTHQREAFLAVALAIVVGVALLMELVGLSPALGAFVAGVVLAESEFRHEIENHIDPVRGLLLGAFFLTVGANARLDLALAQPAMVAMLVLGLIAIKGVVITVLARSLTCGWRDAAFMGAALCQGGEFGFVLAPLAARHGALPGPFVEALILAIALSMALTPLLLLAADAAIKRLMRPAPERPADTIEDEEAPAAILAGYGRFGQVAGRVLKAAGYRITVLDFDPDQVELLRSFGNKVYYGDASDLELLRQAGAEKARLLLITFNDYERAIDLTERVKERFPHLKIVVRARDRRHAYAIVRSKADAVVRESLDAGLALGVAALQQLGVMRERAEIFAEKFRAYDEVMFEELARHAHDEQAMRREARKARDLVEEVLRADQRLLQPGPSAPVGEGGGEGGGDEEDGEGRQALTPAEAAREAMIREREKRAAQELRRAAEGAGADDPVTSD